MKLVVNKTNPPLGGLIGAEYLKSLNSPIEISWADETYIEHNKNKIPCQTSNDILRYLGRNISVPLYGPSAVERTEIDHWLTFTIGSCNGKNETVNFLNQLDKYVAPVTYLSCKRFTIADCAVFGVLYGNKYWKELASKNLIPINVLRWFKYIESQDFVSKAIGNLPAEALAAFNTTSRQSLERQAGKSTTEKTASGRAKEGKFVELPGAEMGKVVVRFPPEASGYLHIGHAKAALLNQYYQQAFQGKLIMRFDDTNPAKENAHFEKVILEDVAMLQIQPDLFTHTSQYFDLMLEYCEKLIKEKKAYVDDTDAETMKQEREQRIESVNRANSVEKNLQLWKEMVAGSEVGQKCCVRAKIDMQSANGCMRDPTIYRCKNEEHPRTGTKYRVYPTYDFACPIVDAIENVTHVLRTMEYHDRDPQFYWFIEALGLRKPHIWEYSRLSMTNTVLSKRKLAWFVSEGYVDGWDDPRMPTVRGILRRGMTVEGLKEFIIAQGSSRSVVFMEWDKIWAFNKKVIDPVAPRYTSVDCDSVTVLVKGAKEECLDVPKHPKNQEIGNKSVWVGPKVIIDRVDADCLKEGENATFINWGNLLIKKINRDDGKITTIEAEPNLDNKDYKKTLKLTFLAITEKASFTPTYCVYFDYLISKALLGKDEDFKKYASRETRKEIQMVGDPELKNLKNGDIIQLQRRGFFRVDVAYEAASLHSCKEQPIILFYVPDGHTKANPLAPTINETVTNKTEVKSTAKSATPPKDAADLVNQKIIDQGNTVRSLKAQKSPKAEVDAAVKTLLTLKAEFKTLTGTEWKPSAAEKAAVTSGGGPKTQEGIESINQKIIDQGNVVRDLKAKKAAKGEIDAAVKMLLSLKAEFKALSGNEWKPGCLPEVKSLNSAEIRSAESSETVNLLNEKITNQGNLVRDLKSKKAAKGEIDAAVKILLSLKADFKALSGSDWKPGCIPEVKSLNSAEIRSTESIETVNSLNEKITNQGNLVRDLKSKKASKGEIDAAVKILLNLKADFKALSGNDWKPGCLPEVSISNESTEKFNSLNEKITRLETSVLHLKAQKGGKVDAAVKDLSQLKLEYKTLTGNDWKPAGAPEQQPKTEKKAAGEQKNRNPRSDRAEIVNQKIIDQGNMVRNLKAQKAEKGEIDKSVKILLDLKAEYKSLTGVDWKPASGNESNKNASSKKDRTKEKAAPKVEKTNENSEKGQGEKPMLKKQTRLGLEAKKEEKFSEWYSQIITKGEMCSYYDVSGCYILRPWSMSIWEEIKNWFDAEIKALGVKNCYFPMFVSRTVLEKEKDHIADFAPEVAWVTKAGESDLAEPIAIRPTSETVMYPEYAKWIQSYRDLPIKLNQWNNVVRWEFKHPQPFLRTREFLWQEGHTAYADKPEAMEEVKTILDLYARIYTDLLAIPVIKGKKTMKEKFAGGEYTLTVEAYISTSGRAIQGATSHHLGQNFSKMFEITYEDPKTKEKNYVYQNSWGITTRTIGVMIMIHSDNQGLVLPPRVASVQVMIVPCGITVDLSEEAKSSLQKSCQELEKELLGQGVRVEGDYRLDYSPGWKFNHWELKGVPIRIELGPKDIEKNQVVAVRRDTGKKLFFPRDAATRNVKELLENIQSDLLKRATDDLENHLVRSTNWNEFLDKLEKKKMILVPFCGEIPCEDRIKAESKRDEDVDPEAPSMGAKSLCIPFEQPELKPTDKCIHPACKNKPQFYTLFGRSY